MGTKNLVLSAAILSAGLLTEAGASDPQKIESLVIRFGEAYRNADIETIDRLLASKYSHINDGGKPIDREAYLDWNKTRKANLNSGAWSVSAYELSGLEVTVFPGSAVVTGVVTASGERDGEGWSSRVRFTNLWVEEDGAWRRAAFHDTKLDEEAAVEE